MIDRDRKSVLGIGISVVDYEGVVTAVIDAARRRRPLGVSALAVHGVMTGALDPEQKYRLNALDILTPDGQPVRWALRLLHGQRLPDRVYGPELAARLCAAAEREGLSVFLYGSRQSVVDAWAANLGRTHPDLRIAGIAPSQFRALTAEENMCMVERIRASGADMVFVGLGCPRQEVYVFENRQALSLPLIAVGAAFDFHAGLLPQAPKWMQDRGLEWVFRLRHEPRRLWRRYLYLNPLYLWFVARQGLGLDKARHGNARQPAAAKRLG